MKRFLQLGNIFTFIFALVANALAATQTLGGASIKEVSDTHQTFLTPATYAFSIWGLIYLLLLGFVLYQARDFFKPNEENGLPQKLAGWFMLSSIANGLWTVLFVHEMVLASLLTLAILTVLLYVIMGKLKIALEDNEPKRILFIWWPILFYTGWVTAALAINAASYLQFLHVELSAIAAILVLAILTLSMLIVLVTRNARELLLANAWGIVAIGVARLNGPLENGSVSVAAFVAAGILLAASMMHAYMHRKSFPTLS